MNINFIIDRYLGILLQLDQMKRFNYIVSVVTANVSQYNLSVRLII